MAGGVEALEKPCLHPCLVHVWMNAFRCQKGRDCSLCVFGKWALRQRKVQQGWAWLLCDSDRQPKPTEILPASKAD